MTKVKEVPFLIIGGGIGGLTAALGIAETGRAVVVLEKAPEFGEIGAGIQLGPNAMAVLDKVGLLDAVTEKAVFPQRLVVMDALSGKELTALDLGDAFRKRYGYPYIVMHRSDLHSALVNACRANNGITLVTDQDVVSVENLNERIRVTCSDNTTYLAESVIGADGLWSKTRRLLIDDEPICSQYVAYRGTLPMSEVTSHLGLDDVIMWIAPNLHLVQYPVRKKELYNQVVVFKSFRYQEGSNDWGTSDELDEHFGLCCPLVRQAVTYIQRQQRWPMYDREPIDNWTSGRFTLLGDAAHPMLQYIAQGACQAMEDAACLAEKLNWYDTDIERAFLDYQQDRTIRTAKVQRSARLFGEIIHTVDPITALLRNTLFAQRSPDDFQAVDWLYGHRY